MASMEEAERAHDAAPLEEDDVLRERRFHRPKGLNLDSFMVAGEEVATPPAKDAVPAEAEALTLSLIHI